MSKASASRTSETVAEGYEEIVFHLFEASEAIRHDRAPGFMSDFSRAFNRIADQRQQATITYRHQTNDTAQRMVQPLTRSISCISLT